MERTEQTEQTEESGANGAYKVLALTLPPETNFTLTTNAQVVYKDKEHYTCPSVAQLGRHTSFKAARRFITLLILRHGQVKYRTLQASCRCSLAQ